MEKIWIIIQREYLSRVKKKSFIWMTILGPLFIGLVYGIAIWAVITDTESKEIKHIVVIDENDLFRNKLQNSGQIEFHFSKNQDGQGIINKDKFIQDSIKSEKYFGLLYIPFIKTKQPEGIQLFSEEQPGIMMIDYIKKDIERAIHEKNLQEAGLDKKLLDELKVNVNIKTIKLTEEGQEETFTTASFIIGIAGSIIMYIFIFMYGVQVMRGVLEEKTNRIVEIIISSVRPSQLMFGKIIGIVFVGITQFILWSILIMILSYVINFFFLSSIEMQNITQNIHTPKGTDTSLKVDDWINAFASINYLQIGTIFIFYFLTGYFLYSALFAAIGAAVDNETDTQQFIVPITLPLILGFILAQSVIKNPDSTLAFWLSILPLTSPVIIMTRIPFGIPAGELLLSMFLMIIGFLLAVWVSGKVYRVGILMYGKKATIKELWKWIWIKE